MINRTPTFSSSAMEEMEHQPSALLHSRPHDKLHLVASAATCWYLQGSASDLNLRCRRRHSSSAAPGASRHHCLNARPRPALQTVCDLRAIRKPRTTKRHEPPRRRVILRSNNRRGNGYAPALTPNDVLFDEEPEVPADIGIFRSPFEIVYTPSTKPDTRTSNTPAEFKHSFRLLNKMEEDEISGDDEESLAFQGQPMRRGGRRRATAFCLNSLPTPPRSPQTERQLGT